MLHRDDRAGWSNIGEGSLCLHGAMLMEAVCVCAGMIGLDRADASQLTAIVEVAVHGVHAGEIADTNVDVLHSVIVCRYGCWCTFFTDYQYVFCI